MQETKTKDADYFGTEKISKVLLRTAPPIMLSQLVQSMYNLVDSYFVGQRSADGLTALSVIFPIQSIIEAFAIGTAIGVNTFIAKLLAQNKTDKAKEVAGAGVFLAVFSWAIFAVFAASLLSLYVNHSTNTALAREYSLTYGMIVCIFSLPYFLQEMWSKIYQSHGNMKLPMIAQIVGALVNIVLDPIFINGWGFIPAMNVMGAAIATVIGQTCAALIVCRAFVRPPAIKKIIEHGKVIYKLGIPAILLRLCYTVYIVVFNLILATFSDAAVTVLGLYYKWQTLLFIPVLSLQVAIVPILSYNYAQGKYDRCRQTCTHSLLISMACMAVGIVLFEAFPKFAIGIFSSEQEVTDIGVIAFRIIGLCFLPDVGAMIFPSFFQAIGMGKKSNILIIIRHFVLFIPLFIVFSFIGLNYVWISFPIAEGGTALAGLYFYLKTLKQWNIKKS